MLSHPGHRPLAELNTKVDFGRVTDRRTATVRDGYDAIAVRHLAWISKIKGDPRERFLSELITRLPRTASVLDLGCGAGVPATERLARDFDVTAVDISEAQLRLARERIPAATFLRADLLDLEFESERFDAICALYAISHVPRDNHAPLLQRIAGWLKPGGWFLASMGARGCPDTTERWLGVEMFFSSYDAATNRRLVAESGLDVEIDEIVSMVEPEGDATFLWILARRP